MRILLDACLPERLRHDLASAGTVETARFAGLSHLSNGALIAAMAGRFDVLVTIDANLQYQQNLSIRSVAVVVVRSKSNDIGFLRPLMPAVISALVSIEPGTVIEVQ
jgi:predicted nuclease of predicted toxin-antitoxin system